MEEGIGAPGGLKAALKRGQQISEKAKRIMVEGDASVLLPLMISSLLTRLEEKKP
jgi:deoxyhypusine synthase